MTVAEKKQAMKIAQGMAIKRKGAEAAAGRTLLQEIQEQPKRARKVVARQAPPQVYTWKGMRDNLLDGIGLLCGLVEKQQIPDEVRRAWKATRTAETAEEAFMGAVHLTENLWDSCGPALGKLGLTVPAPIPFDEEAKEQNKRDFERRRITFPRFCY